MKYLPESNKLSWCSSNLRHERKGDQKCPVISLITSVYIIQERFFFNLIPCKMCNSQTHQVAFNFVPNIFDDLSDVHISICQPLFSLYPLLQKVYSEPGDCGTPCMACVCLTVWTCKLQQAFRKQLIFLPGLSHWLFL